MRELNALTGDEGGSIARKGGRQKREGLRNKQIIFLQVLAEAAAPLPRPVLCEEANAHPTNVTSNALGDVGEEARARREAVNGYPSLLTLGYVYTDEIDVDGKRETVYGITLEGRSALKEVLAGLGE